MRTSILTVLALAGAGPGTAHPMPNSVLVVEARPGVVELSISIPRSELEAVGDVPVSEVGGYVARHAAVTGVDGRIWAPEVREARPGELDGHRTLDATLVFRAPPGGSDRATTLRYDAVNHHISSHFVLAYWRMGEALAPLGRLQAPETELKLP